MLRADILRIGIPVPGRKFLGTVLMAIILSISGVSGVLAENWQASKLRGAVFVLLDGQWQQLQRGDRVPNGEIVRTARNGRVQLTRDGESIDVEPDTQLRIFDKAGQKYTVVHQHFGEIAVDANKQDVQHFAVQTQFLTAVVKGTRFRVAANEEEAEVAVDRGSVEVRDVSRKLRTNITKGQRAAVGKSQSLASAGAGDLQQIQGYAGTAYSATVQSTSTASSGGTDAAAAADGGAVTDAASQVDSTANVADSVVNDVSDVTNTKVKTGNGKDNNNNSGKDKVKVKVK